MLSKLKIKLKTNKKLPNHLGCIFHSIFLACLGKDIAGNLHEGDHGYRPYRSMIKKISENIYEWNVVGLTDEMSDCILKDYQQSFIRKHYIQTFDAYLEPIEESVIETLELNELYKKHYSNHEIDTNLFSINFNTPTAFKSEGKYILLPSENQVLQSLLNKWDFSSNGIKLFDYDLLNLLIKSINIYRINNIQTVVFPMDTTNLKGFCGDVTYKLNHSTKQLKQLMAMLFEFSTFSGVGIKTAMGMGDISVVSTVPFDRLRDRVVEHKQS